MKRERKVQMQPFCRCSSDFTNRQLPLPIIKMEKARKKGSSWYREIESRTLNFKKLLVEFKIELGQNIKYKLIYIKFSTCSVIKYKESCAKQSLSRYKNSSCLNEKNNRPANGPHNPLMHFRLLRQIRMQTFKLPKLVR